jgi:DNA-binding transcriptional ArsR family regulator
MVDPLPHDPFDALGDPNRRAILGLLRSSDQSVQELADALPISRPAVSRHLRLLKDAGLVVDRPEGTRRLYRLHDEGVAAVRAYLEEVWGDAAARMKLVAEPLGDPGRRAGGGARAPRRRAHLRTDAGG